MARILLLLTCFFLIISTLVATIRFFYSPLPTIPGESNHLVSPQITAIPVNFPCTLMKEKVTRKVDCFGCINNKCKTPPPGQWERYKPAPGAVGIPYACYSSSLGCALAQ